MEQETQQLQRSEEEPSDAPARLWTRDFTIITIGSLVSLLGNNLAGFAMGLLVLDYTGSTMLYALIMFLSTFPQIIMPLLAGPYLDKFSRKRVIYTLDFITAGLYVFYAVSMYAGFFNYLLLAAGTFLLGCINSVYRVAYDSFYPLLISKGNFQKAYSIAGVLESVMMLAVPVSAFVYNTIGMEPLLLVNAVSFLFAAVMETQVRQKEAYTEQRQQEHFGWKQYGQDFRQGLAYLKQERGLLAITGYFIVCYMCTGASNVLHLPFFRNHFSNGEYLYIWIGGCAMAGRFLGGLVYYRFRMPTNYKFVIALCVYVITSSVEAVLLFVPYGFMLLLMLVNGLTGVTSYNIRISATQSFVPHERKGRFNGIFNMMTMAGMVTGQLLAGGLSSVAAEKYIMLGFGTVTAVWALIVIGGNQKAVSAVYNREA